MTYIKGLNHYRSLLFHPKVLVLILTGVGCMFFTFFTHDNATELAISCIASIFIGIGVNNFTAIEMEQKDNQKIQRKTNRAVKELVHIRQKLKKIQKIAETDPSVLNTELLEMDDYIDLCIQYLEEI